MFRSILTCFLSNFILISLHTIAYAQTFEIGYGNTEIGYDEQFQIVVTVKGGRLSDYSGFPEIPDLIKQNTSTSRNTQYVGGKLDFVEKVTQFYTPAREGSIVVKPFQMTVNGQVVKAQGTVVRVSKKAPKKETEEVFDNFWSSRNQEYVEVEDDAFFSVDVDKKEVYVGEGFHMTVAFYISLRNKAKIEFHKINEQLTEILKQLRPENCWEENFGIDQVNPEYVTYKGQQYTRYKIYEGTFFPLNQERVVLPKVGIKMTKFREAKSPSPFARNLKEDFKTYYSSPLQVKVLPNPSVSGNVGNFQMREVLPTDTLQTGQSYNYVFQVVGSGNISALSEPVVSANEAFTLSVPGVDVKINRGNGTVSGAKTFTYRLQPLEPGEYQLSDLIGWEYFDPQQKKVRMLSSNKKILVIGESRKNNAIASAVEPEGFYSMIEQASNQLGDAHTSAWMFIFANLTLGGVLIGSIVIVLFKRKK